MIRQKATTRLMYIILSKVLISAVEKTPPGLLFSQLNPHFSIIFKTELKTALKLFLKPNQTFNKILST